MNISVIIPVIRHLSLLDIWLCRLTKQRNSRKLIKQILRKTQAREIRIVNFPLVWYNFVNLYLKINVKTGKKRPTFWVSVLIEQRKEKINCLTI